MTRYPHIWLDKNYSIRCTVPGCGERFSEMRDRAECSARLRERVNELEATPAQGQKVQLTLAGGRQYVAEVRRSRRIAKKCTWRQLTVAQSLQIQGADVAVGYRLQCAKEQWLIYRSLGPKANRTLLGQNLSSESLVGRFLASSGEMDALVEIE